MKTNRKTAAMLLMAVHLITGTACTKEALATLQQDTPEEASVIMADVDSVPRRCRVVKRYRSKGEVYRVVVNTPNTTGTLGGTVVVNFADNDASLKAPEGALVAVPIKSQGRNGKDIEFETTEFELGGNPDKQRVTLRVEVKDRAGKTQDVVYFDVQLGPESKQPVTYEASPAKGPRVDDLRIGITPAKDGSFSVEKGTMDVALTVANDFDRVVAGAQINVKTRTGKLEIINSKDIVKITNNLNSLQILSRPRLLSFAGNAKEATAVAEVVLLNAKNEPVGFAVKEVKELADILKED